MAGGREVVIDYEFLRGRQNEAVVKELCVASAAAPRRSVSRAPTSWRFTARQRTF